MIAGALRRARDERGFTLIEIMVALAIMAVLSLLTATTMKSGFDNKALISSELSRDARLADTLRIIRADVAQAFHYRDIFCQMENEANVPAKPTPGPGGSASTPEELLANAGGSAGPTPKPCPPDVTGFIGDSTSMYFSALANVRTLRDSKESDQAKVGYFVKSCRGFGPKANTSNCLYRSISPYLDDEIATPGPETVLVENVEEFKLRYLGPGHEDYLDTWKTGKDGDATTKENFPYAVEITLTLHNKSDKRDRVVTQTVLAPISFMNNPKKKKTGTDATGAPGTPGGNSGNGGGNEQ